MGFRNAMVAFVFVGGGIMFAFNNCAENAEFDVNNSVGSSELDAQSLAAENVLELLDYARDTEARLREQGSPNAVAQADDVRKYIDLLENMISQDGQGLAVDDPRVLDTRDYLLNSHLMGRDMLIEWNFQQALDELRAEDARLAGLIDGLRLEFEASLAGLETRLRAEITDGDAAIQAQLDALRSQFESFQTLVNDRYVEVSGRLLSLEGIVGDLQTQINDVENQLSIVDNRLSDLDAKVEDYHRQQMTAVMEVRNSLTAFRSDIEAQVLYITQQNVELRQLLVNHQSAYTQLIAEQNTLATLQGKMCQRTSSGALASGQVACDADASEDDVMAGNCCTTVENFDCDLYFDGDSDEALLVRNQCNAFVVGVLNRDAQVLELAENQQAQQEAMENLTQSLQNIQTDVAGLKTAVSGLWARVSNVERNVAFLRRDFSAMNSRLLMVEYQASRLEVAAGLNEMSDLYLAWITRRRLDVRSRFCAANARAAYRRSDYKVARHNWVYCQERLKWLAQAEELVLLAKAYTNGMTSVNLNQVCTLTFEGQPADGISYATMVADAEVSRRLIAECSGGKPMVMALMASVVRLHQRIGPDFRTSEYMAKKTKALQRLYFGDQVLSVSPSVRAAFENTDPTTPEVASTFYGRIERAFVKTYVESRMRVRGKYPEDPSLIPDSIPGFNRVHSHQAILGASTPYLARLKTLEVKGHCEGCDFVVTGRNVTQGGTDRYSYPEDATTKCPVHKDKVVVRGTDGKHYAYGIHYSARRGATEHFGAYGRWRGTHYPIANSDSDVTIGKFRRCGYNVRRLIHRFGMPDTRLRGRWSLQSWTPYGKTHGLPQCRRSYVTCRLWENTNSQGEWTAPSDTSNILHYLNGYAESKVQTFCSESGTDYTVANRELSEDEKSTMRYFKSTQDDASKSYGALMGGANTQLTSSYWMHEDRQIEYGVGNDKVSSSMPFFGAQASHGQPFFRRLRRLTDFSSIPVQQCFDGNP